MKKTILLFIFCTLFQFTQAQVGVDFYFNIISPSSVYQTYGPGEFGITEGWGWDGTLQNDVVGPLAYANDNSEMPNQLCEPTIEDYSGKIVLIERGTCEFGLKALNAQNAGAIGVIIRDLEGNDSQIITMGAGEFGSEVTIPTIFITFEMGAGLITELNGGNTVLLGFTQTPNPIVKIEGTVTKDDNLNCVIDDSGQTLENWKVQVDGGGYSLFGLTDENGYYQVFVDTGAYDISLLSPSDLWMSCPGESVSFSAYDSTTVDLQAQALQDCPEMSVDIEIPFLRRCFDNNTYHVNYCNMGTITGEEAYIVVAFDELLSVVSASLPYIELADNSFQFDLGDVVSGDCGQFSITTLVSCDAVFEQALCAVATIFPDPTCTGSFQGADLRLTGQCNGDNLNFFIENKGEAMNTSTAYRVLKDGIELESGNLQLGANMTETLSFLADGATYRLEAEQVEGFPFESSLSATVEACADGAEEFSVGFFNMFPPADYGLNYDEECTEVIGSFDPNDKTPTPKGYGEAHFIEKNTDIQYLIRFQNTGTDTAFNIVVRDTLTSFLQPNSIEMGTASHDYDFKFIDQNILEFTFSNIMLPDSNVNEAASHGFLNFRIKQQPNLANDVRIENSAAIYFDFNDPVITNVSFLTIGENFLVSSIDEPTEFANIPLSVFPNPIDEQTRFDLKDVVFQKGQLELLDAQGRRVRLEQFQQSPYDFHRKKLATGVYFYTIKLDGRLAARGKLVVQ